jgi:cbb3-type cytochrome oxidase subunit 3
MTSDKQKFHKELREFFPVLSTLVLSMFAMGVVFYTFWQVTSA